MAAVAEKTARNALNMVVLAPIPSATESTAAARKPGVFAKIRTAYRTSRKAPSNISTIIISTFFGFSEVWPDSVGPKKKACATQITSKFDWPPSEGVRGRYPRAGYRVRRFGVALPRL